MGKRLIQQRRGRFNGRYTVPSHRFKGKIKYHHTTEQTRGIVEDIIHDPGRTAPLAKVRLTNNKLIKIIAAEGTKTGDTIQLPYSASIRALPFLKTSENLTVPKSFFSGR